MRHAFFSAGALFCFACFSSLAVAQSTGSSQSSSANSQQGGSASASSQTKPDPSAKPQQKKPKKVWTNEEVGNLNSTVSVVGGSSENAPRKPEDNRTRAHGQASASAIAAFRKELQSLRARLEETERQISDLRNFKADNTSPSSGIKLTGRYNMVPLEEQIRQLEAKRKQIQARIDDLEDQARKLGIPPGDLR